MEFWKEKRVLVTGGAGFLGTHLVHRLERAGATVTITRTAHHDLTREEAMVAAFRESGAEYVFHAAADVGGIGYNRLSPADVFRNNTRMSVNVLEAARRVPVRKVVLVGSACAYPGEVDGVMSESDFLAGPMHESVETYGFSKRALYIGGLAYASQYGVRSVFLLLTNLYGPHDKFDEKESHVVGALVRKFVEAKREGAREVVCWGTGSPVREFMYAEDCARAILRVGEVYEEPEPLNIGTGVGTTIRELAETLKDVTEYPGRIVWDDAKPDGAMYKVLDVRRMREALDPGPPVPLREGLAKTVAWYEANVPAPATVG